MKAPICYPILTSKNSTKSFILPTFVSCSFKNSYDMMAYFITIDVYEYWIDYKLSTLMDMRKVFSK